MDTTRRLRAVSPQIPQDESFQGVMLRVYGFRLNFKIKRQERRRLDGLERAPETRCNSKVRGASRKSISRI